jgi:hypothetical protein
VIFRLRPAPILSPRWKPAVSPAMGVLARDLKALGLYAARSLSFEGIEYDIVEHQLTADQIRIYDALCRRFPDHSQEPE